MVFCLIFFVLTLAVAFVHYVQGLMSATISLILVIIAAAVSFGYCETVAGFLVTKFPEQAVPLALCAIFAVVYIVPRLLFDQFIPGNIRFPVLVDKIGAGVMGLLAGLISVGVLATAAQALPFDGSIGMFTRFDTTNKSGEYMSNGRQQDNKVDGLMVSDTFDPARRAHLWLYQDDLAVALASHLSDNSLAGDRSFASIHPDYLLELYGQRIGIQGGAKHVLLNTDTAQSLRVDGVYMQPKLAQVESEVHGMNLREKPITPILIPDSADKTLLIVRLTIQDTKAAADDGDNLLRFSMGSVRLCAGHSNDQGTDFMDYFPVALIDPTPADPTHLVAVAYRVDDFIFADAGGPRTFDLVFQVDKDRVFGSSASGKPPFTLAPGTFLEFKRFGYVELRGSVNFGPTTPNPDKNSVIYKGDVDTAIKSAEKPGVEIQLPSQEVTSGGKPKPQTGAPARKPPAPAPVAQ